MNCAFGTDAEPGPGHVVLTPYVQRALWPERPGEVTFIFNALRTAEREHYVAVIRRFGGDNPVIIRPALARGQPLETARPMQRISLILETTSMFKKLVPVIALALLAGPVFAADAPATTPSSDQSSTASSKHHKKHSHSSSTSKSKKPTTDSSSTAPAK